MKPLLFLLLLFITSTGCAQSEQQKTSNELVIQNVQVIPMTGEQVLSAQTVVIQNGKIKAMGTSGKTRYGKNAVVVDGSGKYLMPGLAEMHAHVPPVDDLQPMKEVLLLFAANGVTTIRGMLGHPRHLELRSKINSGEILGPRFITSGPSFNGNSVTNAAAAAAMVRQQKTDGYDFLKLHPGLTKETFAAIAKTAHESGIPFAGHVSYEVGIWRAIEARYATIDHLDGFVESLVPETETTSEAGNGLFGMFVAAKADTARIGLLMQKLRESNIWVVPTQALAERWFAPSDAAALRKEPEMKYMDRNTLNNWTKAKTNLQQHPDYDSAVISRFIELRRKLIYECNRQGVGLLLGSDAPQVFDVPGFSVHHELRYLVDAGLTPYEALRTGTVNVGTFLRQKDLGVIRAGAVADLVLLNGNPLQDINQTKNIEGVVLNGRWLSKEWINTTLKSIEK